MNGGCLKGHRAARNPLYQMWAMFFLRLVPRPSVGQKRRMTNSHDIRTALASDAAAIAEVQVASWQSSYKGIVPDPLIEQLTIQNRTQAWERIIPALAENGQGEVFVWTLNDRIVGFASMGPQRETELRDMGYVAEVTAIYIVDAAKRRGGGRALMAACAGAAVARGHRQMSVWVLTENWGGRGFYESIGGVELTQRESEDRNAPIDETAYGWTDLQALIANNPQ